MRSRNHRRAGWAAGLSVVLHVLALTGMVVGLKVAKPPPESRAVELQLIRPFEPQPKPQPRPEPVRQPAERPNAAPAVRPRLAPPPPPQAPVATLPVTPAPAPAPKAGPKIYGPQERAGPSGRMGCDDPLDIHLTPDQRQVCANNLARLTREAKPLDLIPADKKAEYDHYEACRNARHAGVPGKNWVNPKDDAAPMPGAGSAVDPTYGKNSGMGGGGGCLGIP